MADLKLARNSEGGPEIFRSIQGEGRNIGRVRTFVRLSGCNLHCRWCDTAYTWNWIGSPFEHVADRAGAPHKFAPAAEMVKLSPAEAAEHVVALPAEGVVITGGEPLMQAGAVLELIAALKARSPALLVEVETNGSIAPPPELAAQVDLFMVSPKLGHSGNDPAVALNDKALAAFAALPQAVFKFVAQQPEDLAEVGELAARYRIPADRIYVMPEGTDSETVTRTGARIVQAVIAAGYSYTDRLHIHLFGQKRGV
jgi:organic radical activating enzyme